MPPGFEESDPLATEIVLTRSSNDAMSTSAGAKKEDDDEEGEEGKRRKSSRDLGRSIELQQQNSRDPGNLAFRFVVVVLLQ